MALLLDPVNLTLKLPKVDRLDTAGGGWSLKGDVVENWAWHKDAFTPTELDAIVNIGTSLELERASTGDGTNVTIRDSFVHFLYPNDVTSWIFARLADVINGMNEAFFGFDLTSMEQGLQFTRYTAPGEHYGWHIDRGMNHGTRKLSLTLQLSEPDDYEGGDLQLWFGGDEDEIITASKDREMMTLFPSWAMHRVKPVTKGTRYSLVCWVSGPSFK